MKRTVFDKAGDNAARGYKKALGWLSVGVTATAVVSAKALKDAGEQLDNFDSVQDHYNTNKSSLRIGQELGSSFYDDQIMSILGRNTSSPEKEKDDKNQDDKPKEESVEKEETKPVEEPKAQA